MASSMDNPVHSPIALNSLYIAKNKTTIVGSTITGKESAVIFPTSSLNASVPVGLLNMYAASAKFKTELSRKDAAGSLKSAFGAFLGFLFGSGIKIIACGVMLWYIIVYI